MRTYTELRHVPGRWIKEGTKEQGLQLVGHTFRLNYHGGAYRLVKVIGVYMYGGLMVPEIQTVKVVGLKGDYSKTELIHYERLTRGVF